MKRRHKILSIALLCASILWANTLLNPAQSQEMGRKSIYLFSLDFPPDRITQNPTPPAQETKFWQLLDLQMKSTDDLALTENMENADYRVEVSCAGALDCSRLAVEIKDAQRNALSSFSIKHIRPYWGMGTPNLQKIAQELTYRLSEKIKLIEQGGYGHTE